MNSDSLEARVKYLETKNGSLEARVNRLEAENKRLKFQLSQTQLALNLNTRLDKQTIASLGAVKEALTSVQKSEQQKFVTMRDLSSAQDKKAEEIKLDQKEQAKLAKRDNIASLGLIGILGFFYVIGEIQAGAVVDAIVALGVAGAWGLFSVAKKN